MLLSSAYGGSLPFGGRPEHPEPSLQDHRVGDKVEGVALGATSDGTEGVLISEYADAYVIKDNSTDLLTITDRVGKKERKTIFHTSVSFAKALKVAKDIFTPSISFGRNKKTSIYYDTATKGAAPDGGDPAKTGTALDNTKCLRFRGSFGGSRDRGFVFENQGGTEPLMMITGDGGLHVSKTLYTPNIMIGDMTLDAEHLALLDKIYKEYAASKK